MESAKRHMKPKPKNKLKKQALAKGITTEQLVMDALKNNDNKVHLASIELGVYPRAITYFLEKHPELRITKS